MPLFTQLGQPEDCTYSFDVNPDPKRYTEIKVKPASKSDKAASAANPAEEKE